MTAVSRMSIVQGMVRLGKSAMEQRLIAGIGANTFNQIVTIFVQLALVPVMASRWGAERYGLWLLLFTVPSYIALSDLGLATAAGTRMTMQVAIGDRVAAQRTLQSASAAVALASTFVLLLGGTTIALLPAGLVESRVETGQAVRLGLVYLFLYGIISLQGGLLQAGFRCAGQYALGTALQALTVLAEATAALLVIMCGGSLTALALAYCIGRVVLLGLQAGMLRRRIPWLGLGFRHADRREVVTLVRPALAVMALPVAQALFLQGTTLVIGLAVSTVGVAVFSSVRTLTRAGFQFTTIVNHAAMPEAARAAARRDADSLRNLVKLTLASSLFVVVPGAIVLLAFGTWIVPVWTAGALHPGFALVATMTGVMVVSGVWYPLSNLLLAVNRQESYSYVYTGGVIVSVALAYPLCLMMQELGAAVALLLLEIFMFQHVGRLVWKLLVKCPLEPV
jgi:O-antigen/teichoic acid export membrane protein